jgi:lipoteichoic acid synthase
MDASFEQFHSTCIIYNAGLKEPIVNENYCCNVDILPTILNLFNIDYDSRILMGTDVFSNGLHRARLYNGSFITNTVKYDKKTGNKIWSDSVSSYSEELLKNHFDAMVDYTESEYTASLQALKNNFWFYVWKNSGLLTEEEIEAEVQRENSYQYDYDTEAQAEAEKAALEAQQRAEQEALEAQQAEGGVQGEGEIAPQPEAEPQPEANPENPNP